MFSLILSVPRITPIRPSLAPAIMKSLFTERNKSSKILDINIDFYNNFASKYGNSAFYRVDNFLQNPAEDILESEYEQIFNEWIDNWIEQILSYNPEHILISVFTWNAQKFTLWLCRRLRPRTNVKIIIGGQGIGEVREQTSWIGEPLFAMQMKEKQLVDHWVKGDAESVIDSIVDKTYTGVGWDSSDYTQWSGLANKPIPDFSDLNIKEYHSGVPNGVIPMEFSRGCVRKCNFCDWVTSGGGFRSKTGRQVFNEIISYYQNFGTTDYYFNDALINGSLREFNIFNKLLVEYYEQNNLPDRTIKYSGHFIIRGRQSTWQPKHIKQMGRAGAESMVVGVESGSDSVRKAMNKGYTTADLDYNMENFIQHNIKLYMLIMIGYPTETRKDFEETLDLVKRYQKYVAMGNISGINFGQTFIIEEGAPIYYHPEHLDLVGVNGAPHDVFWMNPKNPDLTYKERITRRIEAQELATKLGYPIWRADAQLGWLMNKYKEIQQGTYHAHKTRI